MLKKLLWRFLGIKKLDVIEDKIIMEVLVKMIKTEAFPYIRRKIDKLLKDNGLTYQDLDPYTLVMKLPVQAESHNAKFFDLKNYVYIWEIPLGAPSTVNVKFTIK